MVSRFIEVYGVLVHVGDDALGGGWRFARVFMNHHFVGTAPLRGTFETAAVRKNAKPFPITTRCAACWIKTCTQ
jgi:hypothetical protein